MTEPAAKLSPFDYSPRRTFSAKIQRRLTQSQTSSPLGKVAHSMLTFSFDDFPKSAADTGAEILEAINAPAIYYACSGLAETVTPTGEQYDADDLLRLTKAGHEIGAHTHTHLDCAAAPLETALNDIEMNLDQLKVMGLEQSVEHFAYPYGETTIALKKSLMGKFATCRGILPGQNRQSSDRMQLRSMELKPDSMTTDRAEYAIEMAMKEPTWLHIFTHDVRRSPSNFGTRPADLIRLSRLARDAQLPIVTPSQAMTRLKAGVNV